MKGPMVFYKWNQKKNAIDVFYQPTENEADLKLLYEMSTDDFLRFFFNLVNMVAALGKNYRMVPIEAKPEVKQESTLPPTQVKKAPPQVGPPLEFPDAVQAVEDLLRGKEGTDEPA